ncbi:MAG: lipopolysaccharide core heptose(II) kinase RfaY, partial [Candidatus Kapaibacteriota bacterium]
LDFKIIDKIASNNNLEIYKVRYKDKIFIAKGYFKDKFSFEENYRHFIYALNKEANILKKFNNLNINKLFKIIESEDLFFLILEYVDGLNLFEYLNDNHLSTSAKHRLIKKIIEIFSTIHNNNVIHGDIHFGNILIQNSEPLIIDFGLSNELQDVKCNNGGFPLFMPPERINGDFLKKHIKSSNLKSDVYQLGLLIYFILTLKMPFSSTNWKDLVIEKKNFNLILSDEIDLYYKIIKKCISTNLSDRYDNASEIYNEIIKL